MASLLVLIVMKINTIESAGHHCIGWIWLIMSLDVGVKSKLAMLVVVKIPLMKDHAGTVVL